MNYAQIAAAVYQHCTHFDPYLPPISADLARNWGRLFEKHRLNEHDLLAGVDLVYDQNGSGYRPLPADIISAARSIRRDRMERWTDEDQARYDARYEAICDSKAAGPKPLPVSEPPDLSDDELDARAEVIAARIREHVEAIAAAKSIPNEHRNGYTA